MVTAPSKIDHYENEKLWKIGLLNMGLIMKNRFVKHGEMVFIFWTQTFSVQKPVAIYHSSYMCKQKVSVKIEIQWNSYSIIAQRWSALLSISAVIWTF